MAARIKITGPQCFHHREQNGTLRSNCIHCAQPVAYTSPAQHTAGPRGLGPDIDPYFGFEAAVERNLGPDIDSYFGFEAAVERNLDLQRRISHSETQGQKMMSTGPNRNEPIPKNKERQQTVNRTNNAYVYVGDTESWVNTVRSEIEQDGGIQNQHPNSPFKMIDESGVRVRAESDDSNCSLLEAIRQDLQQGTPNLTFSLTQKAQTYTDAVIAVRANRAAQSERHNQANWSGCGFVGKSDVEPALTMPQTLYSSRKPEHVMPSIEESNIPYPYVPLTSVKNRWK